MKFIPLIIRNVLRNKIRTFFTGSSIAMSLFLVVLLKSFLSIQDEITDATKGYNRVMVTNIQGLTGNLPIAYVDRIRKIEGVKSAIPFSWFGGRYRDETIPFAQFGTDADYVADVLEDFVLPPEQLEAWKEDKTGCVVGSTIARNKGWKVGDKIPLKGDIYPVDLELTVRGIYTGSNSTDKEQLWFHFEYMDEALKAKQQRTAGNAGIVMLRAKTGDIMPELMAQIDKQFASSDAPVRAMTEKEFQQSFLAMMGSVQFFINVISGIVMFSLLIVAGNTMAMALRERTREIAVLKAIGFTRGAILSMVLFEAMLIGLLGGVAGAMGAKLLFATVDFSKWLTGFGFLYVPWRTALWGLLMASMIGLLSGIIPAWRAAQLSVVDGLRRVV
jgi:putative ABC transport system permease protein